LFLSPCIFCLNRNQSDARYANFYLSPSENFMALYLCEDNFDYAALRFVESRYLKIYHLINDHDGCFQSECLPTNLKQIL